MTLGLSSSLGGGNVVSVGERFVAEVAESERLLYRCVLVQKV